MIPPMRATLASRAEVPPGRFLFERKYDGYRALAAFSRGGLRVETRNGLELGSRFPSVQQALSRLALGDSVLDGELVAEDAAGRQRFGSIGDAGARHLYVAFDLLREEGADLRGLPLEERRARLERLLAHPPLGVRLAERVDGEAEDALAEAAHRGWEGLIAKRRGSTYEGRRSRAWLKLKLRQAQEVVVGGYLPMKGNARALGALLVGVRSRRGTLSYAGRVGTGFSDKVREGLRAVLDARPLAASPFHPAPRLRDARWTEPRWVAQVAFTEWTADGKLRHPSFLGLREDNSPDEVVREDARPWRGKAPAPGQVQGPAPLAHPLSAGMPSPRPPSPRPRPAAPPPPCRGPPRRPRGHRAPARPSTAGSGGGARSRPRP